jgi:hypothetical protein
VAQRLLAVRSPKAARAGRLMSTQPSAGAPLLFSAICQDSAEIRSLESGTCEGVYWRYRHIEFGPFRSALGSRATHRASLIGGQRGIAYISAIYLDSAEIWSLESGTYEGVYWRWYYLDFPPLEAMAVLHSMPTNFRSAGPPAGSAAISESRRSPRPPSSQMCRVACAIPSRCPQRQLDAGHD